MNCLKSSDRMGMQKIEIREGKMEELNRISGISISISDFEEGENINATFWLDVIKESDFIPLLSGKLENENCPIVKSQEIFSFSELNRPESEENYPILHVSNLNLFEEEIVENHPFLVLPRYKEFLDSSIWNYYVPLCNKGALLDVIRSISYNESKHIYQLHISVENAELNARLVRNSYLQKTDGHGAYVVPFLFHSERKMKELLGKTIDKNREILSQRLRWRILLIDDHANKDLTPSKNGEFKTVTKKDILRKRLEELAFTLNEKLGKEQCGNISDMFVIDSVTNLEEARKCLQDYSYDIILLDYLLGMGSYRREYSYELLESINNGTEGYEQIQENIKQKKIPVGKFYFMYISAFSTAISERLQEKGLTYSNEYWYLGRGACPTTTPELFKYNFLHLLIRQIRDLTGEKTGEVNITLIHLLKEIYDNRKFVRSSAEQKFNALLLMKARYQSLKKFCNPKECKKKYFDNYEEKWKEVCESCSKVCEMFLGRKDTVSAENCLITSACPHLERRENFGWCPNSPLMNRLFPDVKYYSNSFWEHLQHLVYLTAYGTIRQWPEMWEEYMFVKPKLEQACKALKGKEETLICEAIENFIIGLKDNC